jgi:hypothetical protein
VPAPGMANVPGTKPPVTAGSAEAPHVIAPPSRPLLLSPAPPLALATAGGGGSGSEVAAAVAVREREAFMIE